MATSPIKLYLNLLLTLAAAVAAAQSPAGMPGGAAPVDQPSATVPGRPIELQGYVLGPGDSVSIDVGDMPEVSTKSVTIGPDGFLELPMIGSVQAAGLSLGQLRVVLAGKLSRYVNDPLVTLNVVGNGSRFVSVVGQVNAPGVHPLTGPRSLIEVISEAGGLKSDAGPRVIVTRETRSGALPQVAGGTLQASGTVSRLTLPLNDLLASSSPESNIPVLAGDLVSIPKEQLVYVVGDVRRAGGFPMSSRESVSVLQAISLAEGSGPNAALNSARILRPNPAAKGVPTEIPIKLDAILAGKAPDQVLLANDVLFIPKSSAKSGARRAAEIMLQIGTGIAIYR